MTVDASDTTILTSDQVRGLTQLSSMHLHRLEADGRFPRRFKLVPGGHRVGWLACEVHEWLAARSAQRTTLTHRGRANANGVINASGVVGDSKPD